MPSQAPSTPPTQTISTQKRKRLDDEDEPTSSESPLEWSGSNGWLDIFPSREGRYEISSSVAKGDLLQIRTLVFYVSRQVTRDECAMFLKNRRSDSLQAEKETKIIRAWSSKTQSAILANALTIAKDIQGDPTPAQIAALAVEQRTDLVKDFWKQDRCRNTRALFKELARTINFEAMWAPPAGLSAAEEEKLLLNRKYCAQCFVHTVYDALTHRIADEKDQAAKSQCATNFRKLHTIFPDFQPVSIAAVPVQVARSSGRKRRKADTGAASKTKGVPGDDEFDNGDAGFMFKDADYDIGDGED